MKSLFIVESPNKVASIEKYLGSDFNVMASVGHITYLTRGGKDRIGVDIETWTPKYKVDPDKKEIVEKLKKASKKAKTVFVATDPDREGEAIADHLVKFLEIEDKYKRVRFNEITEEAIKASIANPEKIDNLLVESQTARRILDRIIGFKLSGLMRQKIKSAPTSPTAGRVQSIALKLVVEKEKEIEAFVPIQYVVLNAVLKKHPLLEVTYYNPTNKDNKEWILPSKLEEIKSSLDKHLSVMDKVVSRKTDAKVTAFKQSALFKKADSSYGLSAANTQRALQRLYEGYGDGGLISYPRTDSTRLSAAFVKAAKTWLAKTYGEENVADEIKGTAGAQDAHEAIRPTSIELTPENAKEKFDLDSAEFKIYSLVWTQTAQCLLKPSIREITRYELKSGEHNFRTSASKIVFEGYQLVLDEKNKISKLPDLPIGSTLEVKDYNFENKETLPPARYNDGSLIEKLDEIGVGRPSTFATTINILKDRYYVEMQGKALKPTIFGKLVLEKLLQAFGDIINETYTADLEKELDEIADGKYKYGDILSEFWNVFQKDLSRAIDEVEVTEMEKEYAGKKCPKCGQELLIRRNKKNGGRFYGCSAFPNCRHIEPDPNYKAPFRRFKKKN